MTAVQPGDILAVRGAGLTGTLIRFGAALRGQPNLDAHVAVVHHTDKAGTVWCIEGRPGGVGWRDARNYLASRWTVTNAAQPRTVTQRNVITTAVRAALGTPYDWEGIAGDAAQAIGLDGLFAEKWGGQVPGHVVCSSLAAWAYGKAMLDRPHFHDVAHTTPADWTQFCLTRPWER